MDWITTFFASISGFERFLWYLAIPTSFIFLAMVFMTFLGFDGDGEFETDSDTDLDGEGAFQLFTFRNFIYFFTTFAWTGLYCLDRGIREEWTLVISTGVGLVVMIIIAGLFYFIHKLAQDKSIRLEDSVGETATVDVRIPRRGEGSGKITITIAGALRNVNASSSGPEISRGKKVKVAKVENNELIVGEA